MFKKCAFVISTGIRHWRMKRRNLLKLDFSTPLRFARNDVGWIWLRSTLGVSQTEITNKHLQYTQLV